MGVDSWGCSVNLGSNAAVDGEDDMRGVLLKWWSGS